MTQRSWRWVKTNLRKLNVWLEEWKFQELLGCWKKNVVIFLWYEQLKQIRLLAWTKNKHTNTSAKLHLDRLRECNTQTYTHTYNTCVYAYMYAHTAYDLIRYKLKFAHIKGWAVTNYIQLNPHKTLEKTRPLRDFKYWGWLTVLQTTSSDNLSSSVAQQDLGGPLRRNLVVDPWHILFDLKTKQDGPRGWQGPTKRNDQLFSSCVKWSLKFALSLGCLTLAILNWWKLDLTLTLQPSATVHYLQASESEMLILSAFWRLSLHVLRITSLSSASAPLK